MLFTNAHAPGVFCAPSRSAIFTGKYASTTGCYRNQVYFREHPELQPIHVTLAQAGYRTFGVGKIFHHPAGFADLRGWTQFYLRNPEAKREGWPLDSWGKDTPIPKPFPNSIYNKGRKITGGLFLEWGPIPNEREGDMADSKRIDWACDVLKRKHDRPFFLAVGLYAPHFPNYVPQKYFDLYDRNKIELPPYKADDLDDLPPKIKRQKIHRKKLHHDRLVKLNAVKDAIHGYLASISYADAMLGRLLEALRESPYAENTIIVFWSDHGFHHGEKGDWGKHTLWERTSNVPFLWSGPGIAKDAKVDATVSLIDMYPTFNELCGLKKVGGLEGQSLATVLRNPASAKDRDVYLPYMDPGGYAIINQKWRYIHYSDGTEELYDVRKDPNEWFNLAKRKDLAIVMQKLRSRAPKVFAAPGVERKGLRLITDGESFRWELKKKKTKKK